MQHAAQRVHSEQARPPSVGRGQVERIVDPKDNDAGMSLPDSSCSASIGSVNESA
jgi:hypothetical protein